MNTNHIVKNITGYRSEEAYGSNNRDIRGIALYEIDELGNSDISEFLFKNGCIPQKADAEALQFIDKLYRAGYTEALWVCRTARDVVDIYGVSLSSVEAFDFKRGIVLSDLGCDGLLIAYKPQDLKKHEELTEEEALQL